jgi:hypothetical protein
MRYASGNGVIDAPEKRAPKQQPRRFVKGMVISLPGDGRYEIQSVGAMVGNIGRMPSFVQVSMNRPGDATVITRPMSALSFVTVVSTPKGK